MDMCLTESAFRSEGTSRTTGVAATRPRVLKILLQFFLIDMKGSQCEAPHEPHLDDSIAKTESF
jgi:hypothetical protein